MRAALFISLAFVAACASANGEAPVNVTYKGAGWIQFGRIEHSSDTVFNSGENNFNKNWIQNTGGQVTAVAKIDEHWEGGLGLGAIQAHGGRGSLDFAKVWKLGWSPFVTEARATYSLALGREDHKLQTTLGFFPYNYNSDARNLGLYLLRGLVYPGALLSGFETKAILPIASIYGGLIRYKNGGFQNDLLLNSETENRPFFDFSVANLVSYQPVPWFLIGGGVNFYRLIPQQSEATSPGKDCGALAGQHLDNVSRTDEPCFILDSISVDTVTGLAVYDTITGSMAGTKLMGRFRLDPKPWFGKGSFGKDDLVLYGEIGVLGLKNYPKYYENIRDRIPIMMGFNLPAFGFLDRLAFEVEYYPSKNHSDYGKAEMFSSWVPRVPTVKDSTGTIDLYPNNKRDDWKWSLYATKVILGHMRIAVQVANDHLRTGGSSVQPTWAEALSTPKDWYWMTKLAYFF